jgi:predicted phosphodiesterase
MRLLIVSDLHREVWREHAPAIEPRTSKPDVVILAGDIDTGARAMAWANQTFAGLPVLYVHGNHEGYGKNLDDVQNELVVACAAIDHVHYLNCTEHQLDGVRFLGTTLWTDFRLFGDEHRPRAMAEAQEAMNDYKRIRLASQGYRKLRASDTERWHQVQRLWLRQKLDTPFAGPTVVITHMAPSMRSVPEEFAGDIVSAAYASNLDELVGKADLWVHGHMHTSSDYLIGKCRVVCNPCGYKSQAATPENREFNPGFIAEV